jgi:hypothetical protein
MKFEDLNTTLTIAYFILIYSTMNSLTRTLITIYFKVLLIEIIQSYNVFFHMIYI